MSYKDKDYKLKPYDLRLISYFDYTEDETIFVTIPFDVEEDLKSFASSFCIVRDVLDMYGYDFAVFDKENTNISLTRKIRR